ncbi:MAG: hypothetical protein IH795_05210, partial [Bacteroidetes bacterium]|nr:hypothetical protein [Bacteroidota bacterium]
EPLHVEKGFPESVSTVTVISSQGGRQVNDYPGNDGAVAAIADCMASCGPGFGGMTVVMGPEPASLLAREAATASAVGVLDADLLGPTVSRLLGAAGPLAVTADGVEPAQAVFLDDIGSNLKTARQLGMHTIKVDDPTAALLELQGVLGFSLALQAP